MEADKEMNRIIFSAYVDILKYNIKKLRTDSGLSIERFAELCELSVSTYKSLENTHIEKEPTLKTVFFIASNLEISMDKLMRTILV